MLNSTRNVIIGNSAAGLSVIETIRRGDSKCEIALISSEKGPAYSLVFLPDFICGKISLSDLYITDRKFYKRLGVETFFDKKVVQVLPEKHEVLLDDRTRVKFNNLVICTGANSYPVNIKGTEQLPIKSLRTINDAIEIRQMIGNHRKILLIGAGLINLKLLSFLAHKNLDLTLIEMKDQVLPNMVDKIAASIIEYEIKKSGIKFLKNCFILKIIKKKNNKYYAITNNHDEIEIEMIISNTGIVPNINCIESSGIKINKGILIDNHAQTSIANIYAAGDVAESREKISGAYAHIGNWFNAVEQGRIAGLSILKKNPVYEGSININIAELFGVTILSMGEFNALTKGSKTIVHKEFDEKRYAKMTVKEGTIIGALMVNPKEYGAGILRSLLCRQINKEMLSRVTNFFQKRNFAHFIKNF